MTGAAIIDSKSEAKQDVSRPIDRSPLLDPLSVPQLPIGPTAVCDESVHLPELKAGQIWVTEISPRHELSRLHQAMMTTANVIIYDRLLEPIVAEILPLGGYAEPAAGAKTVQRCVHFARDGWSVVRLIDRQIPAIRRIAHLRELAQCWQRAAATRQSAVFLAAGDGEGARRATSAGDIDRELAATIDHIDLTVVFTATGTVPTCAATPANGLAG
jgi:hypothetical protein